MSKTIEIMTDQERSLLLSEFEKYKGYPNHLFDNEEWVEFYAFIAGYLHATQKQLKL